MNDPTFVRHDRPAPPHRALASAQRRRVSGQRGGFAVGLIVGLLIGLALALGVALYVTKVPVPFIDKVPQRTADQDAAEAAKNKNWDPNSPLYGKNPAKPNTAASGVVMPPPAVTQAQAPTALPAPSASASAAPSPHDSAATTPANPPASAPRFTAPVTAGGTSDPFIYFVQAGAYGRTEDAEQQRAKLALLGLQARTTERDQSGRTVFRVRLGPFDKRADADAAKDRLTAAGVEAALVRVQR
ncbi:MAG: SPOR domain-containing protein [Burkholderiales bacterium]|nr:SPOR domain-containing protein [Burkholderiales bacterium]